jgi:hypothetical protein
VRVTAGNVSQSFSFAPDQNVTPAGNQRFEEHVVDFVAGGSAETLSFRAVTGGCAGPIVDDVTVTATAAPQPALGKSMAALAESGIVLVRLPGSNTFERLTTAESLPVGTVVDARKGRVRITATSGGKTYFADFFEGEFTLSQLARKGATADLKLFGGSFKRCPAGLRGSAAKSKNIRHLWGKGSGPFRTIGRFASATVRGTTWLTADQCAGTLVRVTAGSVLVRDLVKKKNKVVKAPRSYFAKGRA